MPPVWLVIGNIIFALLALVVLVAVIARIVLTFYQRVIIFDYERGLRYDGGQLRSILPPGAHWYFKYRTTIRKVDVRAQYVPISGQEILTSDGVTLKLSLVAQYEIADAGLAVNRVQQYSTAVYTELQLALREIVSGTTIDDLMTGRQAIGPQLLERTTTRLGEFGIRLIDAQIKDITFPGELKKIFSQVIAARQEGLAALERARGETAALRNLANAARLLEDNPTLLQLRMLQAVGDGAGNTVVLNTDFDHAVSVRKMPPTDPQRS